MRLGEYMRWLRLEMGYTVEEVAEGVHLLPKAVLDWEAGRGAPRGPHLRWLEQIYGVRLVGRKRGEPLVFPLDVPLPRRPLERVEWWRWASFAHGYTHLLERLGENPVEPVNYRIPYGEGTVETIHRGIRFRLIQGVRERMKTYPTLDRYDVELVKALARWVKAKRLTRREVKALLDVDSFSLGMAIEALG